MTKTEAATIVRRKSSTRIGKKLASVAQSPRAMAARGGGAAISITGRVLDARPDRLDLRDLPYRPPLRSLPPIWPPGEVIKANLTSYIEAKLVRNQGDEGACTGFGLACVANYLLWVEHLKAKRGDTFASVSPRMLYELARRYDEWRGVDYEGSSCRGALKGWNKHGVCTEDLWPFPLSKGAPVFVSPKAGWEKDAVARPLGVYYRVEKRSIVDIQAALFDIGAVYVSANAHDGWDALQKTRPGAMPTSHASLEVIRDITDPKSKGGHAFGIVGYNERGFIVQNSWGESWGAHGFAVMTYEDWINNGTDAWVCALGVPIVPSIERIRLLRFRVPPGQSLESRGRTSRDAKNKPDDPWPIDHEYERDDYKPWPTAEAYQHTLVSGNDGVLVTSDVTFGVEGRPEDYAKAVVVDAPLKWFSAAAPGEPAKLLVYAHGGLNSEEASVQRIRVLGPYIKANGIYPLFMTWRTGPIETLLDIFEDYFRGRTDVGVGPAGAVADVLREGADLAIEATSHLILRGVWTEMRENAQLSADASGRAVDLLATQLIELRDKLQAANRKLEIHLVGHSAGSILLGWLLDRLVRNSVTLAKAPRISSCTLFAAACSVQFAIGTYAKAAQTSVFDLKRLYLHYLTDDNEREDGLPSFSVQLYGKSLLYLVARALDDFRKMPLLGLEKAIDPACVDASDWARGQPEVIASWQQLWTPGKAGTATQRGFAVTEPSVRITKDGKTSPATHVSFDNNIDVITQTLERIRGKKLVAPIEWLDY